jgi:outer membrane protein assembly factor BamB
MFSVSRSTLGLGLVLFVACGGSIQCTAAPAPPKSADFEEVTAPEQAVWDVLPEVRPATTDWPWWRGPARDNKAQPDQDPPLVWSETEHVIWKSDVPGRGHGSPCLWGNRIFLASADEQAQTQQVLAYERETGKQLWQREIHRGGFMRMHPKNTHASVTPACDGQRVFVAFMVQGGIWATALDLDGSVLWQRKTSPFNSLHGYAPSPLIYKSLVIVPADNPGPNFLTALRRDTGEVVWRVRRTDYQSFSSPIVARIAGRDQLIVMGPHEVSSYDPATGGRLWYCAGPTKEQAATAAFDDRNVYASAGFPDKRILAIRADGLGDVTKTHLLWTLPKNGSFIPSPLVVDGLLYVVNDHGLAMCLDPKSGETVWTEKLRGEFSASPVLLGDKIFLPNEDGLMYIFKTGRRYEEVAANGLKDGGFATPVICAGRIYLRTLHYLYCLGKPVSKAP